MSAHLGPALTAYLDGELDDVRREEVQVHLAHCAGCRAELVLLRSLRSSLKGAQPAVPADLAARLLAATAPAGEPQPLPRPHAPRRHLLPEGPWRRAAVGAGFAALGLGGALALAGPPPSGPVAPVDPANPGLVVEHVSTANEVPFAGPGAGLTVPVSAPLPASLSSPFPSR